MPWESNAVKLARLARPLRPTMPPYYLHRPGNAGERAPGWYMRLDDAEADYLGYSYEHALRRVDRLLEQRDAA